MLMFYEASAAVVLVLFTLCLQCAGSIFRRGRWNVSARQEGAPTRFCDR